jgi:glutathionylspermidine synthase
MKRCFHFETKDGPGALDLPENWDRWARLYNRYIRQFQRQFSNPGEVIAFLDFMKDTLEKQIGIKFLGLVEVAEEEREERMISGDFTVH